MVALIIENGKKNLDLLRNQLLKLNVSQVIVCEDLFIAETELKRFSSIDLVIGDERIYELLEKSWANLQNAGFVFTGNNAQRSLTASQVVILSKPFGIGKLSWAIHQALLARLKKAHTLWICDEQISQIKTQTLDSSPFEILRGRFSELKHRLDTEPQRLLAVGFLGGHRPFENPAPLQKFLNQLKAHPFGAQLPVFCLTYETQVPLAPLRKRAEFFVEVPSDAASWKRLIHQIQQQRKFLFKRSVEQKVIRRLLKHGHRWRSLNRLSQHWFTLPINGLGWELLGDLLCSFGIKVLAVPCYFQAIRKSPFRPGPYVSLLRDPALRTFFNFGQLQQKALRYCPDHPQVKEWGKLKFGLIPPKSTEPL
jgi:hypothetical protein